MSKLKSRLFNGTLAFIMMFAMLVTVGTSNVSAADDLFGATPTITKTIQKDAGTTTPTQNIVYTFTKTGFNASTDTANLPDIGNVTLAFDNNSTEVTETNKTVTVTESEAITLPNVGAGGFAKAGEYIYTINETNSVINTDKASMDASQVVYRLHVFVNNNDSGGIEFAGVAVYKVVDESGVTDPTPEKIDGDETGSTIPYAGVYRKVAGSDATANADGGYTSLSISKTVEGDLADLDQAFTFTLNFKASPLETGSKTYTYFIQNTDGTNKGADQTLTIDGTGTATVTLKHKQQVVFKNLPTGTMFYGKETGFGSYVPTGTLNTNGQAASALSAGAGDDLLINIDSAEAANTLLGENANNAAVLNTYDSVSITGIFLDNLPFIILIAVGVAGFGFYAVNRKRNAVR